MSSKKSRSGISGFPEWTPGQRMVEQKILETIRHQFELHGFAPLETRSIEPLDVLLKKGDDKEIYLLKRLHSEDTKAGDDKFGLHFDLTVPFARYVVEFQHLLHFPFKRYQIQKVWRGERKQEGRYREFYQCDIDVIGSGALPISVDAEFPQMLHHVMSLLPIPDVVLKINNRKVLEGLYRGLGIDKIEETLRIVDKLAKIGPQKVMELLCDEIDLNESAARVCLELGQIKSTDLSFVEQVKALGVEHPVLEEGLSELSNVVAACSDLPAGSLEVDLSIARGLNYYTGTVYEGYLVGHEHIGAVCSGGRYDNLAEGGQSQLPGIGVSIGITRILGYLFGRGLLEPAKPTPVQVLVILPSEEARQECWQVATRLRRKGVSCDVHHAPQNYGKQIKAAEKRGIRFVMFMDKPHQVKDLQTGEQQEVDLENWAPEPPENDYNLKG